MRIKTLLERVIIVASAIFSLYGCNRDETYIVSFDANGGTGRMPSQLFDAGVPKALVQNAYTRDGYAFLNWNTMQAGNGTAYTNGQTITVTSDMTLYAQWTSNGTSGGGQSGSGTHTGGNGVLNGHDYVDLGLPSGTKWATSNVGANSPEEYGDYFAWGETTTKETYELDTYRYYDGSNWTKYTDPLTILEASDDAATANWGSGWRMPTYDEMNELKNNCTVTWTTQNGVNGCLFTGSNGNSIFLPAAGCRIDSELNNAGSEGCYWSGTLNNRGIVDCLLLSSVYSDNCGMVVSYRFFGGPVRAVCNQ